MLNCDSKRRFWRNFKPSFICIDGMVKLWVWFNFGRFLSLPAWTFVRWWHVLSIVRFFRWDSKQWIPERPKILPLLWRVHMQLVPLSHKRLKWFRRLFAIERWNGCKFLTQIFYIVWAAFHEIRSRKKANVEQRCIKRKRYQRVDLDSFLHLNRVWLRLIWLLWTVAQSTSRDS